MLSIQPKITSYGNYRNNVSFKSDDFNEEFYQSKVDYYKQQKQELDNLVENKDTPKFFKKALKAAAILTGALLEGWAVYWGSSKASSVIKKAVKSFNNGKAKESIMKVLTPAKAFVKKYANKAGEFSAEEIAKFKNSEFANKKAGQAITIAAKFVEQAYKATKKGLKAAKEFTQIPVKKYGAEALYDKVTSVISKTLGVGSGVAGAYAAATGINNENTPKYMEMM